MDKVTIITVCYNASESIERTVRSVLSQKYSNIEYVIFDGASQDCTLDIIKSTVQDYPNCFFSIHSSPDNGIYDAMNKAVINSSGDWVIFINSGDLFYNENVLEEIFSKHDLSSYDVIYGDTRVLERDAIYSKRPLPLNTFKQGIPFCHQSSIVRRSLLLSFPFDLAFKVCADYNFFYKLYQNNCRFYYLPLIISVYDQSEGGYSLSNIKRYWLEKIRIKYDSELIASFVYFITILKIFIRNKIGILFNRHSLTTLKTQLENDYTIYDLEINE